MKESIISAWKKFDFFEAVKPLGQVFVFKPLVGALATVIYLYLVVHFTGVKSDKTSFFVEIFRAHLVAFQEVFSGNLNPILVIGVVYSLTFTLTFFIIILKNKTISITVAVVAMLVYFGSNPASIIGMFTGMLSKLSS